MKIKELNRKLLGAKYFKSIFLFIIIIAALLIRIPQFYLFYNSPVPGADASQYLECADNLSKGKGYFINYVSYHFKSTKQIEKNITKYGVRDHLEWIPPIYISLLAGLFNLFNPGNKVAFVLILNVFIFMIFLIVFYVMLKKLKIFKDNLIYLSIFFIAINPLMVFNSVNTIMEMLYLLFSTLAFFIHLKFIEKEKLYLIHYLIYSLLLSLLVLTKYVGFVFTIGFLLHFLYKKKVREFIYISIIIFICVSPWFLLRDFHFSGSIFSVYARSFSWSYDSLLMPKTLSPGLYGIYSLVRKFYKIIMQYISTDMFFLLLPFIIIKLFKRPENNYFEISSKLLFVSFFLYTLFLHPVARYQINLLPILIPVGLLGLSEFVIYYNLKRKFFWIIIILISFVYLYKNTDNIKLVKKVQEQVHANAKSILYIDNQYIKNKNKTIATNNTWLYLHYLVNNPVVSIPINLTGKNLQKFIRIYNIGYFIVDYNQIREGTNVGSAIVTTSQFLDLVKESKEINNSAGKIYLFSLLNSKQ